MKKSIPLFILFFLTSASMQLIAQNTIAEAVEMIKAVQSADPLVQDRKRAEKAYEIVRKRVEVLNNFSGTFLQTLPVDFWNYFSGEGNFKTRAEVIGIAREKGWSVAEVAWLIKGGQCDEHASLMYLLLLQAGVTNVRILRSDSPHAFPVVNLAEDFDPDNPWTSRPEIAFIPDTWAGAILTPIDTWYERHSNVTSIYFGQGKHFVNNGTDTNREKLAKMIKNGRAYLESKCSHYNKLLKQYQRYPVDIQKTLTLQPPMDIKCPEAPKLVLLETSFETLNPATNQFEEGNSQKTPTSHWEIGNGNFLFESTKDGSVEIYWDLLPANLSANEPVPVNIQLYTKGGPRQADVAFYPVMDITGWQISPEKQDAAVRNVSVNSYKLSLAPEKESPKDLFREGSMTLSLSAVGKDAGIKDGKVEGGSGLFFKGSKPSEFDAYLLELNCNGVAKMQWTYVPEGSPHLK